MSVYNSEHNSPINSDQDDDVHDPVTRISKLDISNPLHLHPNDTTALTNGSSIDDYYHKLNALWKQYDAMIELPKCACNASEGFKKHNQLLKLMQFFMGLDDSYMQIRSSILSRETLPDVRSTYATISSEESHKVTVGSIAGSSQRNQAYAFVSNMPNSQNFQRSNQNFSDGPSRPNNMNNNRQGGGSGLNNNREDTLLILEKKCSGISEQCEGLLGHHANHVLNVLKDSLNIDKKDNVVDDIK
ncbi:hypothetical protein Tco_1031777 [Tanacetum coccineum]|uniref:Uncharacterized protein n=1 Tax=Tanacetum coccineum TaxID=301880 RepID=A0ABQ5GBB8_9ASTR